MADRKIIGIGETVLDIVFRDDRPTAAVPGGSTFNALISLGRTVRRHFTGVPVLMVTETGDDHVGDIVTSFMEENGVDTSAVTRNPGSQTHISLAFLDSRNDAQYEFYKDHAHASLRQDRLAGLSFAKDDLVIFGSYFAINPKIRPYTSALIKQAHDAGAVIYYDVNFRRNHLSDLDETFRNIEENCRLSTFVRGSEEDFGFLFGTRDPEEIYARHISPLCSNFICTCGANPVHVFTPGRHMTYPVEPVETVSTIGAGDNFNAGFIFSLLSAGIGSDSAGAISDRQWDSIVRTAGRFSSAVCKSIYNYVDPDFEI